MPRGKTFDPDQKIDQAVDLFWQRGCDAVSVQDLVEALGLNRGSLYDTYGGKDQLWLSALARYCEQRNARLAGLLDSSAGPVLPRLRALLTELARIAVERGYSRLEWSVLDWNEPALRFYRSLGAVGMDDWTVHRLAGDALAAVAAGL